MSLQDIAFSNGTPARILTHSSKLAYDISLTSAVVASDTSTVAAATSVVAGGGTNAIDANAANSFIGGGTGNSISDFGNSVILGSATCAINTVTETDNAASVIIASFSSATADANQGIIIGSFDCNISKVTTTPEESMIAASLSSNIHTNFSTIIASEGSTINAGADHSAIISGQGSLIDTNASHGFCAGYITTVSGAHSTAFGSNLTVSGTGSFGYNDGALALSTLSTNNAAGFYLSNGAVIADTVSVQPHAGAILTLSSTTKALLLPVMTTTQMNAIGSPTAGLIIFNSTANELYRYDGSAWGSVATSGITTTSINSTVSGIWAAPQNITYTLFKIGNLVTLCFTDTQAVANTSSTIVSTAAVVPAAYRPAADAMGAYGDVDNGSDQTGLVKVDTTGLIRWYAQDQAPFQGSGVSGIINSGSITYTTVL